MAVNEKLRIKLKGYDHTLVDASAAKIVEAAKKIDMSKISDYDSGLNESLQKAMHEYFDGNVTYEEALEHFYKLALEKYPNLTR